MNETQERYILSTKSGSTWIFEAGSATRECLEAAKLASHMEYPRLLLSSLLLVAATRLSGQQGPPSRADFARIGVEQGRPSPQNGFDIEAATRFARLALDCGRVVSAASLIDAVWGSERSSSDNRLSMAIGRLKWSRSSR